MSVTTVPAGIRLLLWGKAAGRCEYRGCNHRLGRDAVTGAEFNSAYVAHIVADSADGPRGDPKLSEILKAEISNLMLLCDVHHRLIDIGDVAGHPVELLQQMKAEHEERIDLVADLQVQRRTTLLLYGANIGANASPLTLTAAKGAVLPLRYPCPLPITLGLTGSESRDREPTFWASEAENLRRQFEKLVRPRLNDRSLSPISLFAIAPQPLLMLVGSMLTDIPETDVFQLHREPQTWSWLEDHRAVEFKLRASNKKGTGPAALVLSLSAKVARERVTSVLGKSSRIWELTVDAPSNDFLRSREQLRSFRSAMRATYDEIKATIGEAEHLHVFPAAPVAVAVEVGRVRQPKADVSLFVYDSHQGVFSRALEIQ
ncbi:MAG: HNH endonuclease [Myxococcaceae bacterium]